LMLNPRPLLFWLRMSCQESNLCSCWWS